MVSNHLCEYFATVADGIVDTSAVDDKVLATHPSVQNITQKMTGYQGFQFQNLQSFEVEKALQNVNVRKSTGWDGIPPMALKLGATELTNPLTSLFNSCITLGEWPLGWKRGEWTPVLKKEDPHEKGNYRPITVQVAVNKLFEQLLSKQLSYGFSNKLCDKLTAYRRNNSCETALLSLTENWKFALDEHNIVGVLSTDMSKAFNSLYHPLTLAKLKAYGVEERSLRLMGSYFTDRYNRVKLGSVVSEWQRVTRGCPQGSAFGPLIWNIFQNDLTYTVDANMNMYADDHQFYVVRSTLSDVHDDLAVCAESASSWYRANLLKGNLDKYQTMAFGCGKESMDSIMIDNHEVRSTECLKLLAVCIDNNQSF